MTDDLNQHIPEVWQNFFDHMPETDDLTLIVLKGHLLIEEELNKVIETSFKQAEHLKGGRFSFYQTYKIVKAFHFKENRKWLWDGIEKLNTIRNKFAHNLVPRQIENEIEELTQVVISEIGTIEKNLPGKLRHSIAMFLCMLYDIRCRGYAI